MAHSQELHGRIALDHTSIVSGGVYGTAHGRPVFQGRKLLNSRTAVGWLGHGALHGWAKPDRIRGQIGCARKDK